MELITVNNGVSILNSEVSQKYAMFEKQMKELKAKQDEFKEQILKEMKDKQILKLDTPEMTISFVDETFKESFDSKKFKQDHEDMYNDYVKLSSVKASVRVKLK